MVESHLVIVFIVVPVSIHQINLTAPLKHPSNEVLLGRLRTSREERVENVRKLGGLGRHHINRDVIETINRLNNGRTLSTLRRVAGFSVSLRPCLHVLREQRIQLAPEFVVVLQRLLRQRIPELRDRHLQRLALAVVKFGRFTVFDRRVDGGIDAREDFICVVRTLS